MSTSSLPALPPRYEIVRQIGQGGMARVFLARDHATRSDVAIKVLFEHLQRQAAIVERFKREITIARRVAHPQIVQIHDLIQTPDVLALVMEFVPGVDARTHVLRHGPLPIADALHVIDQALLALDHAHNLRVLHRDIKPHNLLIHKGDADGYVLKIADFGIARVDDLISLSTHTQALGTIEYMAPEQLDSHLIDARADLYALGVTAYELLTGQPPFTAPTPMLIAQAHQHAARPLASALREEIPAHLDAWLVRAMAIHPHERFASAGAMREALHRPRALRQVRPTRFCPLCHAELIEGLRACIQCDYPLELALTQPGQGTLTLLVEARVRSRKVLAQQEQDSIIARLRADASCADALHIDWNLGQLPVIIANNLTPEDGERLIALLSTPHTSDLRFALHDRCSTSTSFKLAYRHMPSLSNIWGVFAILSTTVLAVGAAIWLRPFINFLSASILRPFVFLVLVMACALAMGAGVLGLLGAVRMRYSVLVFRPDHALLAHDLPDVNQLRDLPEQARGLLLELRTPHVRALYRQLLSSTLVLHQHTQDAQTHQALGQILEQSTLVAGALAESERELERLTRAQLEALDVLAMGTGSDEQERAHEVLRALDVEQRHMTTLTAELLALHASLDEVSPHHDAREDEARAALSRESCALIEEIALQFDATLETQELLTAPVTYEANA